MRVSAPIVSLSRRPVGTLVALLSSLALGGCLDLNPDVTACSVTVAPTTVAITVNGRATVVGTAFDCKGNSIRNKKITYSTGNAAVATVAVDGTSSGSIIGIGVGSTSITADANGKTASVQVTVGPEVAGSVTVNPSAATLRVGNVRTFTAALKNAAGVVVTGRPIRWTSSNSAIASVDQNGVVTALQPGQVVIIAEADGVTGSSSVLVTLIPVGFCSLTPATQKVTVTAQAQPTLVLRDTANTVIPTLGRGISWSSDNEIVATVSQTGLVSTRAKGTARITATSTETPSVSCNTSIEAVDARIVSVVIQQRTGSLRIGVPRLLTVQLLDSLRQVIQTPRATTWGSLDPAVANISNLGVVTGLSLGNARITVNAEGVADTVTFAVTKIPVGRISVSPQQLTVFEGQSAQFSAVVEDSAGTVVTDRPLEWLSTDPTRATVSATGLVRTTAPGAVGILASTEGRNSNTATLVILQTPVDSIIAPANFTLSRGSTLGFTITLRDAAGNELRNRTVAIVSSQPSIAAAPAQTQTSTVLVQAIAVGTTELTLQALNVNGQAEGKPTKVVVTVTLPTTGNLVAPVRSP